LRNGFADIVKRVSARVLEIQQKSAAFHTLNQQAFLVERAIRQL
jgi:hypothetical protein